MYTRKKHNEKEDTHAAREKYFNYTGDGTGTGGGVDQNTMCFAKFDNSVITDSSSSSKTITVHNGANRSQSHGGIAPALTWPASGKSRGRSEDAAEASNDRALPVLLAAHALHVLRGARF